MKTFVLLLSKRRMGNLFPASMKNWNETAPRQSLALSRSGDVGKKLPTLRGSIVIG